MQKSAVRRYAPLGSVQLGRPALPINVMTLRSALGEGAARLWRQRQGHLHRCIICGLRRSSSPVIPLVVLCRNEASELCLDGEAGPKRDQGGVGLDLGGVKGALFAPDQPDLDARCHDGLEDAPEDIEPLPLTTACQAGMVWQGLGHVVRTKSRSSVCSRCR